MAATFEDYLAQIEELLAEIDEMDDAVKERVFALLDGIDALHRTAIVQLEQVLGAQSIETLREAHPATAWLLEAYGIGFDERPAVEAALESIRPYIHSHGGSLEVLDVTGGIVRLKMSGSCSGCTASAITLKQGVLEALREGFPGFVDLEVEEDDAPAHPPPGATLLQIQSRPS
ncbi:MAG TPA: NifU family protein [Egibacteraceae bacterium]|nr:NifU family protein [Egibacteraceae bacterium]